MNAQTPCPTVTCNDTQQLYIIPCGSGYSCYGYDVLFDKTTALAHWLYDHGSHAPASAFPVERMRGTLELYTIWETLGTAAAHLCRQQQIRCEIELIPQLKGLEGRRIEVVDSSGDTRRFYVGKSTGWMPCHLEIKTRRSRGGAAVYGAPFQSVRVVAA